MNSWYKLVIECTECRMSVNYCAKCKLLMKRHIKRKVK